VNQGGEQGHDDYGLPPVDIEIPDDARELYRDVQAYHRELRALRRHQRSIRWRAPFRRSGIAVPLLAGCLIVALVAVMISAMLTANPYLSPEHPASQPAAGGRSSSAVTSPAQPGSSRSGEARSGAPRTGTARSGAASTRPALTAPAGSGAPTKPATAQLPRKTIRVAGKPLPLSTLRAAALAIVPANCGCDAAVKQLLTQAELAGVVVYLVGPRGTSLATLNRLASLAGGMKATRVATDNADVLTSAYSPVGLTVLLVDSSGSVTVDPGLSQGLRLEKQLQLLKPPSR
jgi:hypothetical protein